MIIDKFNRINSNDGQALELYYVSSKLQVLINKGNGKNENKKFKYSYY